MVCTNQETTATVFTVRKSRVHAWLFDSTDTTFKIAIVLPFKITPLEIYFLSFSLNMTVVRED